MHHCWGRGEGMEQTYELLVLEGGEKKGGGIQAQRKKKRFIHAIATNPGISIKGINNPTSDGTSQLGQIWIGHCHIRVCMAWPMRYEIFEFSLSQQIQIPPCSNLVGVSRIIPAIILCNFPQLSTLMHSDANISN